jgi:hypothetical protein
MEWAKAGIAFPGAAQLHRLRHQIDDIYSGFYLVGYRHMLLLSWILLGNQQAGALK